jgi:hypothetical protein
MNKIFCPKNQSTRIINSIATGLPRVFSVKITPADGLTLSGIFEERRCFWIFPQTPVTGELKPKMEFTRKWINAFYSVRIKPDQDAWVEIAGIFE